MASTSVPKAPYAGGGGGFTFKKNGLTFKYMLCRQKYCHLHFVLFYFGIL